MPLCLITTLCLTACLDSGDTAPSASWEGPTDGTWGSAISHNSFLVSFQDTWDIDSGIKITTQGTPGFGPVGAHGVEVTGTFEVTRTGDSNDSPDGLLGWTAGDAAPSETVDRLRVSCENESLRVGESTICRGTFTAEPEDVPNFTWRFGMHDVAAWPGQTLESAPK